MGRSAGVGVLMAIAVTATPFALAAQEAVAPIVKAPPLLTRPIWDRRPTMSALEKVYPRRLYPDGREGLAAILCRVDETGALGECRVIEESAPGFGEAALKLARLFRMKPLDQLGEPVAGRLIRVPFRLYRPG